MTQLTLYPEPLTHEAFAPFGTVLTEFTVPAPLAINEGWTKRYANMVPLELSGGTPALSLFRTTPKPLPIRIVELERHPLASQTFLPLSEVPFLVLVASGEIPAPQALKLFITSGKQGVHIAKGIWHHYQLALEKESDFWVIDRLEAGGNLEIYAYPDDVQIEVQR